VCTFPAGFQPSFHNMNGGTEGTTTEFVSGPSTVNLGLVRPDQYCQDNPKVATACYLFGGTNPADGTGKSPNTGLPVLISFLYNAAGVAGAPTALTDLATYASLGTVHGLAYRPFSDSLFASAYTKRHTSLIVGGAPGDIYRITGARAGAPGVPTRFTTIVNAGTDPHPDIAATNYLTDAATYDAVGKIGIGGVAISGDQSTLYAVNLNTRSLVSIPIGALPNPPTAGAQQMFAVPPPGDCAASDFRPFAVAVHNGLVYVGAVCTAESTVATVNAPIGDQTKLRAYVYAFTPGAAPGSGSFNTTPILDESLNYPRLCANEAGPDPTMNPACKQTGPGFLSNSSAEPAAWNPWNPNYTRYRDLVGNPPGPNSAVAYPQPIFSSIAFDENGAMIVGFRDRFGDQMGNGAPPPPAGGPSGSQFSGDGGVNGVNGINAGDTLLACPNGVGGYMFERNAACPSLGLMSGGGAGGIHAGQGPGTPGGEFYFDDERLPYHDEVAIGGLLQIPGLATIMATAFNPIDGNGQLFTGGVRTWNNVDGSHNNGFQIYATTTGFNNNPPGSTFGKASGLGGLVALCQSAPLEIGNRVWLDTNGNGIQDAGEPGIQGVTVRLYNNATGTLVGTAITDPNGDYYFNAANVPGGVLPYQQYTVRVDNSAGSPLANLHLSPANVGADVTINSKGVPGGPNGFPQTTVGPLAPGNNNHTLDFGFVPPPDLTVTSTVNNGQANVTVQAGQPVMTQITVSDVTGAVFAPNPITVTYPIPAGFTNVTADGNNGNWSFNPFNPNNPGTITATYTGTKPVTPGQALPPFTITETPTTAAGSPFTLTATVATPGDSNPNNNISSNQISVIPPDLTIASTVNGQPNTTVQVGQPVTTQITVSNVTGTITSLTTDPITVQYPIPAGFTNVTANGGGNWTFAPFDPTNPGTITATYTGPVPVTPGASLPPFTITETPTATGTSTLTAMVATPNDSNPNNNQSSNQITAIVGPPPPPASPSPTSGTTPGVTPTPGLAPDLAISKSAGGNTAQVGQASTFTLVVSNVGSAPVIAPNPITVTSILPVGLTNITATGGPSWAVSVGATTSPAVITATYKGPYPVNPGTSLPPITVSGTFTQAAVPSLTCTARVSTPGDTNPNNNTATATVTVSQPVTPVDLALVKSSNSGSSFTVGQPISFNLNVSNVGSNPIVAPNPITVTNTLGAGVVNVTASGTNWNITISSPTSPNTITATYTGPYPVAPGQSLPPITISGILTAAAVPGVLCSATVSTPGDSNPSNDTSTVTIPVTQPSGVDLAISKTNLGGTSAQVGQATSFNLVVSNVGTSPVVAPNPIIVTNVLPVGLSNVSATGTNWAITLSSPTSPNTITATYTGPYPVNPGQSLPPITITGTFTSAAVPSVTCSATVRTPGDTNPANNTATDTVQVTGPGPNLSIGLTTPNGTPVLVGGTASFVATVSNAAGAGAITTPGSVTVTIPVPAGLTNITVTAPGWTIAPFNPSSPTTITATYNGTVAPGQTLPAITISGTVTSAAGASLSATATVSTPGDSGQPGESATATVFVKTVPPDVEITLSNTFGNHLRVCDDLLYSLRVRDVATAGPVTKPNSIVVTYVIPVGFYHIKAVGSHWHILLSSRTSPALLIATYDGLYPVQPGQMLPAILVSGQLNRDAIPSLTTTAAVSTSGDSDPSNNVAYDTIMVGARQGCQSCNGTTSQGDRQNNNNDRCNNNDQHQHNNGDNQDQNQHRNNGQDRSNRKHNS